MRIRPFFSIPTAALVLILLPGCDAAGPAAEPAPTADETTDVATSVAMALMSDPGGLLEQTADLRALSAGEDLSGAAKTDGAGRRYDETTGTWTIHIARERTDSTGTRSLTINNLYEVQFLNAAGSPQPYYVTEGDTAHVIRERIVEGNTLFETPRSHAERTIHGELVATNTETPTVTVNGTYASRGLHTMRDDAGERTHEYNLEINAVDLVGPRGSGRHLAEKESGVVEGVYTAHVTVLHGDAVREHDIHHRIRVIIEDGQMTIYVDGRPVDGLRLPVDLLYLGPPVHD